jgi:NAD(P)-dependent dehydrogenase (short-subunit alcohol dehydrogenase family)
LKSFVWRRDAAYLITGGLGGVGAHVARSIAAAGARRLILMGHTPLPPRDAWSDISLEDPFGERIGAIRALEAEGVAVHIANVDVSNKSQLLEFLNVYVAEDWPPIRGVIHAAGAVDNHLASELKLDAFDAVVGPKLRGAQNLSELLPNLDLFIMMSSIGGFFAQSGAANYSAANAGLDALAQDRRARGLPAVSIAWGVWDQTGFARDSATGQNLAELVRQGVQPFSSDIGAELLVWLCGFDGAYLSVLPMDWQIFKNVRRGRRYPIFERVLAGASDKTDRSGDLQPASGAALDQIVRKAVAAVLKMAPSRLDARKVLGDMGLTSLLAMELRNRLEADLRRPLPATIAWNYPTIEAMVGYLSGGEQAASSIKSELPVVQDLPVNLTGQISDVAELSDEQAIAALRA